MTMDFDGLSSGADGNHDYVIPERAALEYQEIIDDTVDDDNFVDPDEFLDIM